MTDTLINISGKLEQTVIELYSTLNRVAGSLSIPYVVIGKWALDIYMQYAYGVQPNRTTLDIDFGIQVVVWESFQELKGRLASEGFTQTNTPQRLRSPSGMDVDIVPFGKVEDGESNIAWPPDGGIVMNVLGFQEVYEKAGIVRIQDSPALDIHVATPAGIVLLKLIAWTDRRSIGKKDAKDLFYILNNYDRIPAISAEMDVNNDLTDKYAGDVNLIGAYLLGRDVHNIASIRARRFIQKLINGEIDGLTPELLTEDICDSIELQFEKRKPLVEAFLAGFGCCPLL